MKYQYIEAPKYEKIEYPSVFLGGPIQGTDNWQVKIAATLAKSVSTGVSVLNPRRSYTSENFNYEEQIDWEYDYLNLADYIIFYAPDEVQKIEGRTFGQTTRFEIGEWFGRLVTSGLNKQVYICLSENFDLKKYIYTKTYNLSNFHLYNDLDKLIEDISSSIINEYVRKPNIFFTADTHFSAERTLELSKRPFRNIREMDEAMINNWNAVVGKNDHVYHAGDFGDVNIAKYLNGNIHLIMGNYERRDYKGEEELYVLSSHFYECNPLTDELEIPYEYIKKYLECYNSKITPDIQYSCGIVHEPSNIEKYYSDNSLLFGLYGHIHEKQRAKYFDSNLSLVDNKFPMLNIGVDCNNFRPISLDQVLFTINGIVKYCDEEVWFGNYNKR